MIILAIHHPVVARQVLLIVLVPLPGRVFLSFMPYESCAQALSESLAPIVNDCHAINLVISAALQGVFVHDPQRRYSSLDAPDLVGGRRLRGTYAVTDLVAGGLRGLHRSMRLMTPKEIQIHIHITCIMQSRRKLCSGSWIRPLLVSNLRIRSWCRDKVSRRIVRHALDH